MSKKCTKCGEIKALREFGKLSASEDGFKYKCKVCKRQQDLVYYKTVKGLITKIYASQRSNSKQRGHIMPNYTKPQLTVWINSQPNFQRLWDTWVASNYNKTLIPSCDRDNDYLPYTLDNLTLTTWGANDTKASNDRKNGKNNKTSKAILQYTEEGVFIKEHHSLNQAARDKSIGLSCISRCCRKERKTAGGYIWKFKNDE